MNKTAYVACGQVLVDRNRHIAIVVKKGIADAELVGVSSGILRVRKLTSRTILNEWCSTDYPFEEAMKKLFSIGEQRGMTNAARDALNSLMKSGKEPAQAQLF